MSTWQKSFRRVNRTIDRRHGSDFVYRSMGSLVEYPIRGALTEAQLDEYTMPGRYIRFLMPVDSLAFAPVRGDQIDMPVPGSTTGQTYSYDITEVDADEYESFVLMLRKAGS